MLVTKVVIEFLKDKDYRDLLLTTLFVILFGTLFFHFVEGWRWLDSIYFCIITLTTVGYGDFTPVTDLGKIFNIVYILVGVGLILTFIKTVSSHYLKIKSEYEKKHH